jgi:hypothetical protein
MMGMACLLSACNHARVQTEESYLGAQMPCPDHVVVSYLSISPQTVRLEQGVSARIVRVVEGQSSTMQQQQAAQAAGVAPAEELVARLRRYGLPAELATEVPQAGRILLVQGRILSVDQGNRTRRMLIGLGAGKSSVTAETQLFYATDSGTPRFMTAFQGEVDSGHLPGAAETIGVGAAA